MIDEHGEHGQARRFIAQARERGAVFVSADSWAEAYDVRVLPADR